jgi:DNA mismatch repair protein MutS
MCWWKYDILLCLTLNMSILHLQLLFLMYELRKTMNSSNKSAAIWQSPLILSSADQPASIDDLRPSESDYGVLDPKTFETIEAEALFTKINYTKTNVGHLVLYRSLGRPAASAPLLQQKQAALQEIATNPETHDALSGYIEQLVPGEKSLNHLLYGEFVGGLTTEEPIAGSNKLEFGGHGYRQFKDGTRFAAEMVEAANKLPYMKSSYLRELINAIDDFAKSRIYALMKGPVYLSAGKFKTKQEKPAFLPLPRFRPSLFKLIPILLYAAAIYGILFVLETMLPALGDSYIGYGILALTIPVFPIILLAMGVSDRDTIIYPLRKQFRESPELAKALEALGLLDELLSYHRYAQSFDGDKVLPDVVDKKNHRLTVKKARNPLLINKIPDYVPNNITLDPTGRLTIITGPNSGGKTAYCKTIAQIQLLGQMGCYIPAAKAQLAPVEHIYYQAPDAGQLDLGMGRFGHELKRTREIFFNSTPRSLVILDELSEGTTFEEKMTLSEYILKGFHQLGASILLVTHNHELCERLQEENIGRYLQIEFTPQGPTHRLIAGVSRVSHAERVATEIGFSKEDVEKHLEKQRELSD